MLKQHQYYVYYAENRVYARCGDKEPVLAETCKTPQEAHDKVQAILNPTKRDPHSFTEVDKKGNRMGFLSKEFQTAIAGHCEQYVKAAYGKK